MGTGSAGQQIVTSASRKTQKAGLMRVRFTCPDKRRALSRMTTTEG